MNKINEVFTMPMSVDEFIEISNNGEIGSREIRCIVKSLNHADALADALDLLIQECGKVYSNSSALGDAELKAKIALANYRGES